MRVLLLVAAGCVVPSTEDGAQDADADADTDTDTDTDSDADGDTDTDTDTDTDLSTDTGYRDTGRAVHWLAGTAQVVEGTFQAGTFGSAFTTYQGVLDGSYDEEDYLCRSIGGWFESGEPVAGCPDCEWTFRLTVRDVALTGDYCAQFGLTAEYWEGFEGDFGAAPASTGVTAVFYYARNYQEWLILGYSQGSPDDVTFFDYYAAYPYYSYG